MLTTNVFSFLILKVNVKIIIIDSKYLKRNNATYTAIAMNTDVASILGLGLLIGTFFSLLLLLFIDALEYRFI